MATSSPLVVRGAMGEMVKLTPEIIRDWYSFDIPLSSGLNEWQDRYVTRLRAANAIEWLYDNSLDDWGFIAGDHNLGFLLKSREDLTILSLQWSSL